VKVRLVPVAAALATLAACGGGSPAEEGPRPVEAGAGAHGSWTAAGSEAGLNGPQNVTALWTGREALVVVGATYEGTVLHLAAYDPRAGTWEGLPPSPHSSRSRYGAVWTGHSLIVWGGASFAREEAAGGTFDLAARRWTPISDSPLGPRFGHTALWTGESMLVWGGAYGDFAGERSDGAAYEPTTDSWRAVAASPLVGRYLHTAVWTGGEMLVWGGSDDAVTEGFEGAPKRYLADGAAYDPTSDSWRPLAKAPFTPHSEHTAVWTGSEMLVWDGIAGAAYDPAADTWRSLPTSPLSARHGHTAVWTGEEMLVWGGQVDGRGDRPLADGAAYSPARDEWTLLPDAPLGPRDRHAAVWTDGAMLVWGGCCSGGFENPRYWADGALYDPAR
jgi:hypothetical protein